MATIETMRASLAALQRTKRDERERRIDRLVRSAQRRGEDDDRIYWSIVHDLEAAPTTTNRCQLEEIGFEFVTPAEVEEMAEPAVRSTLGILVEALALIRVFLCRTDHLDDRRLLVLLLTRVVEEPVPDLPLLPGVRDWIDCSDEPPATKACGGARRDSSEESRFVGSGRGRTLPRP